MQHVYWAAVLLALGLIFLGIVIALGVWNHRRRSIMTPTERILDDAEARREAPIW